MEKKTYIEFPAKVNFLAKSRPESAESKRDESAPNDDVQLLLPRLQRVLDSAKKENGEVRSIFFLLLTF